MGLPSDYQHYIHASRYARWVEEDNKRESWDETVDRYISFFKDRVEKNEDMSSEDKKKLLEILG